MSQPVASRLASVVLPVHNQAGHIEAVLQEHVTALSRLDLPFELLVIVNGHRRDQSLEICERFALANPAVRTFYVEKGGWGSAVRAGLSRASGDILCYTNSARTTGKDLLLMLLYGSIHPESVIKANRKIRDSLRRRLGSLLYNLECRALFDLPYWDINGTPKVFPRALAPLLSLTRDDDLIDLEFNAICRREGYSVLEVPIFSARRHSGNSTTSLTSAFRMYLGAVALWRQMGAR